MTHRNLLFLILTLAVFTNSACNQQQATKTKNKFSDAEIVRIYRLADEHKADSLALYFEYSNNTYIAEAALCAASVQDTLLLLGLLELIKNNHGAIITNHALYALGQFASWNSLLPIQNHFHYYDSLSQATAIEALCKILARNFLEKKDEGEWKDRLAFIAQFKPKTELQRIAWGKGITALHRSGVTDDTLMMALQSTLDACGDVSLLAFTQAMAAHKGIWFADESNKAFLIEWCKSKASDDVRQVQMMLLAKTNDEICRPFIWRNAFNSSQQQGVRVAAIRALAKFSTQQVDELLPLIQDKDEYVVAECLNVLKGKLNAEQAKEVKTVCDNRSSWIRAQALKIVAASGDANASQEVYELFQSAKNGDRVHYAAALAGTPSNAKEIFKLLLAEKDFALKTALCNAFIETHQSKAFPKDVDYLQSLHEAFNQGDISVQALVAIELREQKLNNEQKTMFNNTLKASLAGLKMPAEIETFNEIVATINAFGIDKMEPAVAGYNHAIDWKKATTIARDQKVCITTNKGSFVMQLDVEAAPGSVTNFIQLIEQGFYNGKTFHRVIPNFVVQGGCPRGDGMGGMDYTIRSEFALHNYKAGAVGLASAGKDTESCQFFVTHCSTPHLEGRYTIMGYVMEGMDVIEKIIPGDVIEKIELI